MDFSCFPSALTVYLFFVVWDMVSGAIPHFEDSAEKVDVNSLMQKIYLINKEKFIDEEPSKERLDLVLTEIQKFSEDNKIAHEIEAIRMIPAKDLVNTWTAISSIDYQSLNLSDDHERNALKALIPLHEKNRRIFIYIARQAALVPQEEISVTMDNWPREFLKVFLNGYFEDCMEVSPINQKRIEFLQKKIGEAFEFASRYAEWSEGEGRAMPSFRPIDPEKRGCTNYEILLDTVFKEAWYSLEEYANDILDHGLIDPQVFAQ